ncbi:hypothetical protein CRYUN_Cryun37aG0135200 [Craigia yunnanensis]
MKKALPANAKISKDAKKTIQECVSEFISFIIGEASYKCQRKRRKTINGDDLLWALTTLGFENYADPLKIYLHKFKEMEGERIIAFSLCLRGLGKQTDQRDGSTAADAHGTINIRATFAGPVLYGRVHSATMISMGHHQTHMYGYGTARGASYGRPS